MTNTNEKLGSKDLPEHNSANEGKLGRTAEDKTKADLLTNTPGSPRVPSAKEMAKSPNADGQDGRLGLKKEQMPNKSVAPEEEEND